MLAQKEHKRRHNKVCSNICWALCKKCGVKVCERRFEHKFECVIKNDITEELRMTPEYFEWYFGSIFCPLSRKFRFL